MRKHLMYLGAAGALGLVWYAALMLTGLRVMLLTLGFGAIVGLCLLSILMAAAWRKPIVRSETLEQATGLALGLPLLGAVVFVLGLTCVEWVVAGDHPTSLAGALGTALLLTGGTTLFVGLFAFHVVIPMGAISLWVLRGLGQRLWPDVGAGHMTSA